MKSITLNLEDDEKAVAVPGYEGRYVVTTLGRVFSLLSGKFLKGWTNTDGYLRVDLWDSQSNVKTIRIHKLVARAFLPDWDNPYLEVDHINRDTTDNRLINLRMVTRSQNNTNRDKEKLIESLKLAMRNTTAYNRSKPCICCETGHFFWSSGDAVRSLGKKDSALIRKCCRGIIKSAYGYTWRYATPEEIAQHS